VSVRQKSDGSIILEGQCPVEDAESLLELLQATPSASLDWRRCSHLHTAVFQVILAARPALIGSCGDAWVERWAPLNELKFMDNL
jgi:hypothetical protein